MAKFSVTSEVVLRSYPDGRLYGRLKSLSSVRNANRAGRYPLSQDDERNLETEIKNIQEEIARRP